MITREELEILALAAVARELGDDKAALRFLDAYNGRDTGEIDIVPRLRGGKGRPPLKRDPDATAIGLMDSISRGRGITKAETLARMVLKSPKYRRTKRNAIGVGDVKRLAAKFRKVKTED